MNNLKSCLLLFLMACLYMPVSIHAQSAEQKKLEAARERLQSEIKQINSLLADQRKERKSVLEELEDLDHKVRVRKQLIRVTNQQANLLNREIRKNSAEISELKTQLASLKEDYAAMIQKSYKSRSQQSRLMFLLSSEDFLQAYKRVKYMQQYAAYRQEQGQEIVRASERLAVLNEDLLAKRKDKEKLIRENSAAQKELEGELKNRQVLVSTIKKKEASYAAEIKKKQRESEAIDKQIDKLIREAIARSNRNKAKSATGSKAATGFALTAEARVLGNSFRQNKGKLPWPVEKGVVKIGYGTQPHPVVRSVQIKSNGVRIATEQGAKARSVFNGKVLAVTGYKGGNKAVLIQHGSYISVYNNLSKVFVKEGDQVATKQNIGEVFTNKFTRETLLKFMIYNNDKIDNPSNWIYRM